VGVSGAWWYPRHKEGASLEGEAKYRMGLTKATVLQKVRGRCLCFHSEAPDITLYSWADANELSVLELFNFEL